LCVCVCVCVCQVLLLMGSASMIIDLKSGSHGKTRRSLSCFPLIPSY
jgi:hypothetical protein